MSPRRRRLPAVCLSLAAVLASLVLAACGASETSQVRSKVMQFATAAHGHDYSTICSNVLAPALLADIATGGISCQKALTLALASVRGARLVIGTITVSGSRASVVTLTQAKGEKTSLATLELTKTSGGWRIDSLGAYFAYVRHPFPGVSAWTIAERLARDHGVLLLPAPAFAGSEDHLRVSFANVDSAGIERLVERLAGVPTGALAA